MCHKSLRSISFYIQKIVFFIVLTNSKSLVYHKHVFDLKVLPRMDLLTETVIVNISIVLLSGKRYLKVRTKIFK